MRILIANDDGIHAQGIQTLFNTLSLEYDCVLVAPDRNRSGASNSLSLTRPLQPSRLAPAQFSIDGTPTDCVNLALSGVIDGLFDLVISGINHGANLGDDVIYSGTVAAALEARHLGRPALAISLVGHQHFETATAVVQQLLRDSHSLMLPAGVVLNINVPDLPLEALKGIQVTRLGHRKSSQPAVKAQHPRGIESYWIGALSEAHDNQPGTDFFAVEHGYVSVTPLHVDMTCHQVIGSLSQWVQKVAL